MKVAVTGAVGMIGSALLPVLLESSDLELVALSRREDLHRKAQPRLRWVVGDLQDPSICDELIAGVDAVIHLAHSSVPLSMSEDWVEKSLGAMRASLNLFKSLSRSDTGRPPKLVLVSSGGTVYRSKVPCEPFIETDPCDPSSIYGIEKLAIEHHLRLLALQRKIQCIILRVANAYGRLLPSSRKQGLIGTALSQALKGDDVRIIGSLENIRDYIHIDDVCAAIANSLSYESDYEIFNIGTGVGHSVREVVNRLESFLGRPLKLAIEPTIAPVLLPAYSVLNNDKAKRLMAWQPRIDLANGIRRTVTTDSSALFDRAGTGW